MEHTAAPRCRVALTRAPTSTSPRPQRRPDGARPEEPTIPDPAKGCQGGHVLALQFFQKPPQPVLASRLPPEGGCRVQHSAGMMDKVAMPTQWTV